MNDKDQEKDKKDEIHRITEENSPGSSKSPSVQPSLTNSKESEANLERNDAEQLYRQKTPSKLSIVSVNKINNSRPNRGNYLAKWPPRNSTSPAEDLQNLDQTTLGSIERSVDSAYSIGSDTNITNNQVKYESIEIFGNDEIEQGLHTRSSDELIRKYPRKPNPGPHPLPKYQQQMILSNLQAVRSPSHSCPPILIMMAGTEHFHFKKCKSKSFPEGLVDFKKRAHRLLEIRNRSDTILYYAGEIGACRYNIPFWPRQFVFEVIDLSGLLILTISGKQCCNGMGSSLHIKMGEEHQEIGKAYNSCGGTTYNVYKIVKNEDKLLYKIQAPCYRMFSCVFWCCIEHFDINQAEPVTEEGRMAKFWPKGTPKNLKHEFGVQLPKDMIETDKALLLGCGFLIYYQHFRGLGNGGWMIFFVIFLGICIFLFVKYFKYLD